MLYIEVFVWEGGSVDGNTPCPVSVDEISALDHETVNTSMEDGSFVSHWFAIRVFCFSSTKLSEILGGSKY